jgi:hypothetical protein
MSDLKDFIPKGLAVGEMFEAPTGLDFGADFLELKHGVDYTLPTVTYPELASVIDRDMNWKYTRSVSINNPTTIGAQEYFGVEVDFDYYGERVAIGASRGGTNHDHGAVYIYKRTGLTWALEQQIDGPLGINSFFGADVRLNATGDYLFVNAFGYSNGAGIGKGAILIYKRSGTTWSLHQQLYNDYITPDLSLYRAIRLSGDGKVLIVGDQERNVGGIAYSGAVRVFRYDPTSDVYRFEKDIDNPDGTVISLFGQSLDLSFDGSVIVVGASSYDFDGIVNSGSAYVFTDRGNSHEWVQTIRPPISVEANLYFGEHIAVHPTGHWVAIGSRGTSSFNVVGGVEETSSGCVRMFHLNVHNKYTPEGFIATHNASLDIYNHNPNTANLFPSKLKWSADGTKLVTTDYGYNSSRGQVATYEFSSDDQTSIALIHYFDNTTAGDGYGLGAAISGDGGFLCFGAPYRDVAFGDDGKIEFWYRENQDAANIVLPAKYYHDYLRKYLRVK